jgi:hypothetical protein
MLQHIRCWTIIGLDVIFVKGINDVYILSAAGFDAHRHLVCAQHLSHSPSGHKKIRRSP